MQKYRLGIIDESEKDRTKSLAFFEDDFDCIEISLDVDNEDELISQVIENKLDAVAIDYKLIDHPRLDFNGNIVLKKIMDEKFGFPAFILTNLVPDASDEDVDDFRIISKRAVNPESPEGEELIKKLKNYIIKYNKELEEKEVELFNLIQKEQSTGLNDIERERVIELDNFLEHSISNKSKIPSGWKKPEGFNQLKKLVSKTDELLNELKKRNG
jgi:hypothetical protein